MCTFICTLLDFFLGGSSRINRTYRTGSTRLKVPGLLVLRPGWCTYVVVRLPFGYYLGSESCFLQRQQAAYKGLYGHAPVTRHAAKVPHSAETEEKHTVTRNRRNKTNQRRKKRRKEKKQTNKVEEERGRRRVKRKSVGMLEAARGQVHPRLKRWRSAVTLTRRPLL